MPIEFQTALISAGVAILTAALGAFLTWNQIKQERERIQHEREQIQQERQKWLVDIKTMYAGELHKARLASYPQLFELLGQLSRHAQDPLTPAKAQQIGQAIHAWLYSPGGLCAESSTRGALKGLRHYCLEWKQGARPPELGQWRHAVLFLLRRDLDLQGFESFDPKDSGPLLKRLQAEMSSMQ